jgi:hypothetical protein
MTEEQRTKAKALKQYLDTLNRTGTLQMSDDDFRTMKLLNLEIYGQELSGWCKTCIHEALKRLVRDAND